MIILVTREIGGKVHNLAKKGVEHSFYPNCEKSGFCNSDFERLYCTGK